MVEPMDIGWAEELPECENFFQRVGWFKYFEKINGFHPEVSYGFSQGLDKDMVLFNTLKIKLTRELIDEATYIIDGGEFWFKKVPFTFNPKLKKIGVKECRYIILSQNGGSLSEFYKVMLLVKAYLHLFSSITSDSYNI